MFHINYGSNSYQYRNKRRYLPNFRTPVYWTSPLREFPLEFCNGGGLKKVELCPYQTVKKFDLDTLPALDRRTERQKCRNNIALCMHCMLKRDKDARNTVSALMHLKQLWCQNSPHVATLSISIKWSQKICHITFANGYRFFEFFHSWTQHKLKVTANLKRVRCEYTALWNIKEKSKNDITH